MSKVVHLSNEAHAAAKAYCKENGLKMSDWVASLITKAICFIQEPEPEPAPAPVQQVSAQPMSIAAAVAQHQAAMVPAEEVPPGIRKKRLTRLDEEAAVEEAVPVYARPPFWAASIEPPSEAIDAASEGAEGAEGAEGVEGAEAAEATEAAVPATIPSLSELDLA